MAFNNGPKLVTQGLNLLVDAGDPTSYPGTGTTWRDVVGGQNGIITGSVSYTSSFYGGLVFSGPTASVIFPTSSANFGTGSFTVELAFRPARIEGIHYLVSKNSGSFPNWGIYLSGSGGSGKLFSEFRISSTVSCSVSSSTTFVTGSNYQVDVRILPGASASAIYVDGQSEGGVLGNGGGSLTNTGSLLIGNIAPSSSQAFSGSVFASKIYTIQSLAQPPTNYNAIATRLNKSTFLYIPKVFELLVVAGGGSGGTVRVGGPNSSGGGAGGLQYISNLNPSAGSTQVIVGAGGTRTGDLQPGVQGQNSTFGSYVSIGGGFGSRYDGAAGGSGGSGGGSSNSTITLGTPGQGNNGGASFFGGGGGGAGTAGSGISAGSGSFISPFSPIGGLPAGWFAGGGGGGSDGTPGGIGGGGAGENGGAITSINDGAPNTGGGGGAGSNLSPAVGSQGGSGIVAIRYSGAPIALGGEITQSAGYTYHVFRTVGTSSFTIF